MRSALVCVVFLTASSAVGAQTPGGLVDFASLLRPDMLVWLTDAAGREQRGRIISVSAAAVTFDAGGVARQVDASDVRRIRVRDSDPIVNGALIGAGVAIALGVGLCRLTEPWDICNDVGPMARIGAIGAAAGIGTTRSSGDAARSTRHLAAA